MDNQTGRVWAEANSVLGSIADLHLQANAATPSVTSDFMQIEARLSEIRNTVSNAVARFDALHERIYGFRKPPDAKREVVSAEKEGVAGMVRDQIQGIALECLSLHALASALEKFV